MMLSFGQPKNKALRWNTIIIFGSPSSEIMTDSKVHNQVFNHSVRWFIPVTDTWMDAKSKFINWLKFIQAATAVFQLEAAPTTGALHIQANVKLKEKKRSKTLARGSNVLLWGVEISEASIEGQMELSNYVMKATTRVQGPWGWPIDIYKGQDLYVEPRPWQRTLEEYILKTPDRREIVWIQNSTGNAGKSQFVKKMCWAHGATYLAYARTENLIATAAQKISECYLVDLSKSMPKDIGKNDLYAALEQIKNGMLLNTKFAVKTVFFNPPHVLVFSNFKPAYQAMSADRWRVMHITEDWRLADGPETPTTPVPRITSARELFPANPLEELGLRFVNMDEL